MPKIINGIRDEAIKCAQELISSGEYDGFSMRKIAERCNIAVGTLYNYFASKQDLLMAVIESGFSTALDRIDKECSEAKSIADGICIICTSIRSFSESLTKSKTATLMSGLSSLVGSDFERQVRSAIAEKIEGVLDSHGYTHDKSTTPAITEVIISLSARCELEIDSVLVLLRRITEKLERLNRLEKQG